MSSTVALLVAAVFTGAVVGIRIDLEARSRAWRRIAEERRWNWERRLESGRPGDHGATTTRSTR
jgi:hypothetical protein